MSIRGRLVVLLWLLSAAAAMTITIFCALSARDGQVSAFALVPLMWSVALLAGFVHHWRLARGSLLEQQPGALLTPESAGA